VLPISQGDLGDRAQGQLSSVKQPSGDATKTSKSKEQSTLSNAADAVAQSDGQAVPQLQAAVTQAPDSVQTKTPKIVPMVPDSMPGDSHSAASSQGTGSTVSVVPVTASTFSLAEAQHPTSHSATPQAMPTGEATAPPIATATTGIVNSAALIKSLDQTQMRVGMYSAELGNLSVTASLANEHLRAVISSDRADSAQQLLTHVHGLESKLSQDHAIHARVEVDTGDTSFGNSSQSRSGDQQQRSKAPLSFPQDSARPNETASGESLRTVTEALYTPSSGRLDITA